MLTLLCKFIRYNLQQGMALISVLLFMVVFSLLSLCALENNVLELKMVQAQWHKTQMIAAGKQPH
jgi:Tfp pilus assembly protein PilX